MVKSEVATYVAVKYAPTGQVVEIFNNFFALRKNFTYALRKLHYEITSLFT